MSTSIPQWERSDKSTSQANSPRVGGRLKDTFLTAIISVLLFISPSSPLAETLVPLRFGGIRATKHVVTFQQIRQAKLVRQGWDISCGAAALSTLLKYHLGHQISEAAIVVTMLKNSDPLRIRSRGGFSLLDLKRFVQALGYEGKGYGGLSLQDLNDFHTPLIIPVRIREYDHFVIFRGFVGNRIFLGDPAFGSLSMDPQEFFKIWKNGIGFIVMRKGTTGKKISPLSPGAIEMRIPDFKNVFRSVQRIRSFPHTRRPITIQP